MRKSVAIQSLEEMGLIEENAVQRPDPPEDLTAEQKEEWLAVVKRLPADWFQRETHAMLSAYCRHASEAKRIAAIIEAHTKDPGITESWLKCYDRLLKLQEREGRAMSSIATRLRFTNQATFSAQRSKPDSETEDLPWDD